MKVSIDILKQHAGRTRNIHSASNTDAGTLATKGEIRVTETAGQKIHNTNYVSLEGLFVYNAGDVAFKVRINTTSIASNAYNDITLNPGDFTLVPNPETVGNFVTKLYAITAGDVGIAQYWLLGT